MSLSLTECCLHPLSPWSEHMVGVWRRTETQKPQAHSHDYRVISSQQTFSVKKQI